MARRHRTARFLTSRTRVTQSYKKDPKFLPSHIFAVQHANALVLAAIAALLFTALPFPSNGGGHVTGWRHAVNFHISVG